MSSSVKSNVSEKVSLPDDMQHQHEAPASHEAAAGKAKPKTRVQIEKELDKKLTKEERLRKRAAVMIQCAYRRRLARVRVRDVFRSQYRKIYQNDIKRYVYQHKQHEDEILNRLPRFFKYQDYPAPRDYEAPLEYNPGNEMTGEAFALLITCTEFKLGKWTPLRDEQMVALNNDHDMILDLLTHDFYGKLRQENVISLKNPVVSEVQEAFQKLRKIVRCNGFLTIYISTHVTTVVKGEKGKNKHENCYFSFRNTLWTTPPEIAESSLSLTDFIQLVNAISTKRKTLMINYAHLPPPRKVLFAANKLIYPPPDFLSRLSHSCNCAIVTSCVIGFLIREYAKGHPGIQYEVNETADKPTLKLLKKRLEQEQDGGIGRTGGKVALQIEESKEADGLHETKSHQKSTTKIVPSSIGSVSAARPSSKKVSLYKTELWANLLKDWNITPPPETVRTPPPEAPQPVWDKPPDNDFQILVKLPTPEELSAYNKSYYFWKAKRTIAKPVNFAKETYYYYKKVTMLAPSQSSLLRDGNSVFGRAIMAAIKGGISDYMKETSHLKEFFQFIYKTMQADVTILNIPVERPKLILDDDKDADTPGGKEKGNKKDKDKEKEKDKDKRKRDKRKEKEKDKNTGKGKDKEKDKGEKKVEDEKPTDGGGEAEAEPAGPKQQTPGLFVPSADLDSYNFPLFYRCGPPPAPERPYILKVTSHEVTLEWYNPPFEGYPPTKYRIFMQNVTRNFHYWNEVYYAGDIINTKFVVRDLPMGVACQFKVQAFNPGGWGAFSEPTAYVTPGEDQAVLPDSVRWKRLNQSGLFGIMDRMDLYPFHRKEQYLGLKMINGYALCGHGFKKVKLAIRICEVCLRCLNIYMYDPEIIVFAISIIGWCLVGRGERKVRALLNQRNLNDVVTERLTRYRYLTTVVAAVQWLRTGNMSKYITEVPEFKYRVLFPEEEEEESSSDEEEDGKAKDNQKKNTHEKPAVKA